MRSNWITAQILNFLEEGPRVAGEILDLFLTDYATSYRRARHLTVRLDRASHIRTPDEAARHRLYDMLSKLRRDGIIERTPERRWQLTRKGREKKKSIAERERNRLPQTDYPSQSTDKWNIVVFDIPEREKRKRAWLRGALYGLGFRLLQRSVWVGKVKIPEAFIRDLGEIHLSIYVEILSITTSGSLRQIEVHE